MQHKLLRISKNNIANYIIYTYMYIRNIYSCVYSYNYYMYTDGYIILCMYVSSFLWYISLYCIILYPYTYISQLSTFLASYLVGSFDIVIADSPKRQLHSYTHIDAGINFRWSWHHIFKFTGGTMYLGSIDALLSNQNQNQLKMQNIIQHHPLFCTKPTGLTQQFLSFLYTARPNHLWLLHVYAVKIQKMYYNNFVENTLQARRIRTYS